jgi:hypothetical protein
MNYKSESRSKRESEDQPVSKDSIHKYLEQLEREEKHQRNLVEQQKKMKNESPEPPLKPETPEETAKHDAAMFERLVQIEKLTRVGRSKDDFYVNLPKKVKWQIESSEKISSELKEDLDVHGLLKEKERQQFEDAIRRAESLDRENLNNEEVLDRVDKMRKILEDYDTGQEVRKDDLLISTRRLGEELQKSEQEKLREELQKRMEQVERQSKQINMELQQKASGPSGSVGEKIEQKIIRPDKSGGRGKKG